ncbi:MAG TPA: hypothetical protein VG488_07635 [Candidatus Angelobacter sp.]|jgi:hypothetical protein|nr:hypothetical protein [Candidatus Angelobacter sp.]
MSALQTNRVLVRLGARVLNTQEVDRVVAGGVHTNTACTFASLKVTTFDGDRGECGPVD